MTGVRLMRWLNPIVPATSPAVNWRAVLTCGHCGTVTQLDLDMKLTDEAAAIFNRGVGFACHCPLCDQPVVAPLSREAGA